MGGGRRVGQFHDVGTECANAAGRKAEERGGCVRIEGLPGLAKHHEEQAQRHAKPEAKDARGHEVSHARSLRWYALVHGVAWPKRHNGVAGDADVACPFPRTEHPLVRLQHEMCLPVPTCRSDLLGIENASVRRGVVPEGAYLRCRGGISLGREKAAPRIG